MLIRTQTCAYACRPFDSRRNQFRPSSNVTCRYDRSDPCIERHQMAAAECDVARRAFAKMHSTLIGRIPLGHRLFRLLAINPGSPLA